MQQTSAIMTATTDPVNISVEDLNSATYKGDYKKFREKLLADAEKYHRLETWYARVINYLSTATWGLAIFATILTSSNVIISTIQNSSSVVLTQEQFNYAMLISNWLTISFAACAGVIQKVTPRESGNLAKHTSHKIKAREYLNILTATFNKAYSDKIISTEEMADMVNLINKYESEQVNISNSGSYYASTPVPVNTNSTV